MLGIHLNARAAVKAMLEEVSIFCCQLAAHCGKSSERPVFAPTPIAACGAEPPRP